MLHLALLALAPLAQDTTATPLPSTPLRASKPGSLQLAPTGLALPRPRYDRDLLAEGDEVVFVVEEDEQGGVDLNGDGDATDRVLHRLDMHDGTTTNLGVAVQGLTVRGETLSMRAGRVGMSIVEAAQGNSDLNGDGDSDDELASVYDLATDTLFVSDLSGRVVTSETDWVAIAVEEADHGDLDGDGSATEEVVHVWNTTTGEVRNLQLPLGKPAFGSRTLWPNGGSFLFAVEEDVLGADRNGDGDLSDAVLYVYDAVADQLTVTGFALHASPVVDAGLEALIVHEGAQGSDLNGDGQTTLVLVLYDQPTQTLRVLPYVLSRDSQQLGHGLFDVGPYFRMHDGAVALYTHESNRFDYNGDGDSQDELVVLHEFGTGESTPLAHGFSFEVNDAIVALETDEGEAGADLNGDGDAFDYVLTVFDRATRTWTSSGLGISPTIPSFGWGGMALQGSRVAFLGGEVWSLTDHDGDGQLCREQVHVYDASRASVDVLPFQARRSQLRWSGRQLAFFVERGDVCASPWDDRRQAFVDTRSLRVRQLPFWSELRHQVGRRFLVAATESEAGIDHNGDGDLLDQVLLWGEVRP